MTAEAPLKKQNLNNIFICRTIYANILFKRPVQATEKLINKYLTLSLWSLLTVHKYKTLKSRPIKQNKQEIFMGTAG